MSDDRVYLDYILECIALINEYVGGDVSRLRTETIVRDAVLRNLHTLAESTQRLSDAIKATQPTIPWPQIGAFRNVVVHNYLGIDLDVVWRVIRDQLPELRHAVIAMRAALDAS